MIAYYPNYAESQKNGSPVTLDLRDMVIVHSGVAQGYAASVDNLPHKNYIHFLPTRRWMKASLDYRFQARIFCEGVVKVKLQRVTTENIRPLEMQICRECLGQYKRMLELRSGPGPEAGYTYTREP